MTTQLLTRNIDTQTREEAAELTEEVSDRHVVGTRFLLDDGSEVNLPAHLSALLSFVVSGVTQGDLRIQSIPEELTTKTASEILGISRPTLMKMVADETLSSHRVGSHHRFLLGDVLDLKTKRTEQRAAALERLREIELEHGAED